MPIRGGDCAGRSDDTKITSGAVVMILKIKFEDEIYSSLSCLPMAARRKLDQLGLKIGFDQWQQISRGEKLMICHAPITSDEEIDALRLFVNEVMLSRCGAAP